jgi:hypothetical protein
MADRRHASGERWWPGCLSTHCSCFPCAADMNAVLDAATVHLVARRDRHAEDVRGLRRALGCCWNVAIAALPDPC